MSGENLIRDTITYVSKSGLTAYTWRGFILQPTRCRGLAIWGNNARLISAPIDNRYTPYEFMYGNGQDMAVMLQPPPRSNPSSRHAVLWFPYALLEIARDSRFMQRANELASLRPDGALRTHYKDLNLEIKLPHNSRGPLVLQAFAG